MDNFNIKLKSRDQLKGYLPNTIFLNLAIIVIQAVLYGVVSSAFKSDNDSIVVNIIGFIINIPIFFGCIKLYLAMANNEGFAMKNFWGNKRTYTRTTLYLIAMGLIKFVLKFASMLLLIFVFAAGISKMSTITNTAFGKSGSIEFAREYIGSGNVIPMLIIGGIAFFIYVYVMFMYFMAPYIIEADCDDIGVIDSFRYSRLMMKGEKKQLLMFYLSFIGWYIGTFITIGILGFYLAPYMYIAKSNFYLEVIKKKEDMAKDFGILNPETEARYRNFKDSVIEDMQL